MIDTTRTWGIGVGAAVGAAVAGLVVIVLARWTDVPGRPWAYIGVAVGAVGAASLVALGTAKAYHEAEVDDPEP